MFHVSKFVLAPGEKIEIPFPDEFDCFLIPSPLIILRVEDERRSFSTKVNGVEGETFILHGKESREIPHRKLLISNEGGFQAPVFAVYAPPVYIHSFHLLDLTSSFPEVVHGLPNNYFFAFALSVHESVIVDYRDANGGARYLTTLYTGQSAVAAYDFTYKNIAIKKSDSIDFARAALFIASFSYRW